MDRYMDMEGSPLTSGSKHPDGSYCLKDTQRCPEEGAPCCELFEDHTVTCIYDIRYEWWQAQGFWVICIASSAGGGGIKISHCPHCGTKLWPG